MKGEGGREGGREGREGGRGKRDGEWREKEKGRVKQAIQPVTITRSRNKDTASAQTIALFQWRPCAIAVLKQTVNYHHCTNKTVP